jgi:hypothetical protein
MNASPQTGNVNTEAIRTIQRERSAALLAGDIPAARGIHADDFQLVTPLGAVFALSKSYAAARSMRLWVSTRIRISFFWLTHLRARSAEPSSRLFRENPLSICHRCP